MNIRNPFPAVGGTSPEPLAEVKLLPPMLSVKGWNGRLPGGLCRHCDAGVSGQGSARRRFDYAGTAVGTKCWWLSIL